MAFGAGVPLVVDPDAACAGVADEEMAVGGAGAVHAVVGADVGDSGEGHAVGGHGGAGGGGAEEFGGVGADVVDFAKVGLDHDNGLSGKGWDDIRSFGAGGLV